MTPAHLTGLLQSLPEKQSGQVSAEMYLNELVDVMRGPAGTDGVVQAQILEMYGVVHAAMAARLHNVVPGLNGEAAALCHQPGVARRLFLEIPVAGELEKMLAGVRAMALRRVFKDVDTAPPPGVLNHQQYLTE